MSKLALLVDDDITTRVALQDYLLEADFEVLEADNGLSGLELFQSGNPDIVLLDVSMPGIDGFETCRRLRQQANGKHVPVLMMTGHDDVGSVDQAYESGATDFTSKPINIPLLVHRIRYLLRAKELGDQLRVSESSLEKAQRIAKLGSWIYDFQTYEFFCSAQVKRLFDWECRHTPLTTDDIIAKIPVGERDDVLRDFRRAVRTGVPFDLDFNVQAADGTLLRIHQETDFERDPNGRITQVLGTYQDVTESWEAENRIREIAFFDNVTGLPNRTFFMRRLSEMLALAKRNETCMALMFVDLDQFKRVNDSWGHQAGDELLRQVSKRLQESLRTSDVVSRMNATNDETFARLGGDEFVLLLPQIGKPDDPAVVARRLLDEFKKPFVIEAAEVYVSGSIGISVYPSDGTDEQELLKHADIAMYRVKEEGRNGYRFFSPEMNTRTIERLNLETSLWKALENGEFVLQYQPKISLRSNQVVSAEALVRWQHPTIGLIAPTEFIGVAEECGLIGPLGQWVLQQSCRQAAEWLEQTGVAIQVGVNISAEQFQHDELVPSIVSSLEAANLHPSLLLLEITESTLMRDTEDQITMLQTLRNMGISVAIDDFGTGYSSLSYLKRLPIDSVKIDRSFIRELTSDPRDAAIVRGTIALAHNLELKVVAEGVEDEAQNTLIRSFGCDEVQGYLYSPALPGDEFMRWAAEFNSRGQANTVSAQETGVNTAVDRNRRAADKKSNPESYSSIFRAH